MRTNDPHAIRAMRTYRRTDEKGLFDWSIRHGNVRRCEREQAGNYQASKEPFREYIMRMNYLGHVVFSCTS
jgi:hypothetical protein